MTERIPLKEQDTYIFTDVSNIRAACLKTLGLKINFVKLYEYFERKYPNLKEVRYYEGIASDDAKKRLVFSLLERIGYTICPLERKSYNSREMQEKTLKCPKCGNQWTEVTMKESKVMKSNVDVFLAAHMVAQASKADHPIHIILVSCDGDYAEAIKTILELNENMSVTVLATPFVRDIKKNTLSVRIKCMRGKLARFKLRNIADIISEIKAE